MTRRDFLSTGLWGLGALGVPARRADAADVTLRIGAVTHEVAPGHVYRTTAYNGRVPGPLIELQEGVPVEVAIFNDTDTMEYVHWHGLLVPPELDGTAEEGSLCVPAHGELRYRLTPGPSGFRYVHSHAMSGMPGMPGMSGMPGMDLSIGTYSGQFACVYIRPRRGDAGDYDQEIFLATHEWGPELVWMDDDDAPPGMPALAPPPDAAEVPEREVQYDIGSINGRALGHGEPLRVKQGQRVLFHVVNASATATIDLALPGHEFLVTALDGNPVPRPRRVSVIQLATAERVDAIVEMNNPGVWILGSTDDRERERSGVGIVVEYAGRGGEPQWRAPATVDAWDYTQFGLSSAEQPAADPPHERVPMIIERVPPGADGMESWTINGRHYDDTRPTRLRVGRRYRLVLQNETDDEHPMHLHRYSFELARIGRTRTAGLIKDVVLVPPLGSVEIDVTPDRPGLALLHCHQQMHMDTGFKTLLLAE